MAKSRTENSIKNSTVALLSQGATLVLSFVTRTIFIKYLGASYLGINGLFTNILSVLSFAEMGFGTAIVYALYKPLAENNYKKISALMNFYTKVYRGIGLFILFAGLLVIPNFDFFIGNTFELPRDLPPLWLVYILYLLDSSVSYFLNYKRSLVTASQNGYIDSLNQMIFSFIRNFSQILILLLFKNFLLYLIIQIICTFLANLFIYIKADRLFPYLKENKNEKLDKESLKSISKNVLAMASHKFGSVMVSGTDNILISKFVGVIATGYYSNYVLLTTTVRTFYIQIMAPVTASLGNFVSVKSGHESYLFFQKLLFINAYIAIFCTTCLVTLANPFIELLWGSEYLFPYYLVCIIMLNFFLNCMRQASTIFIDACGLFWQIKWKSLIEAVINLAASLFFAVVLKMGTAGIVLGTLVSCAATNFWWEPYVVYRYVLNHKLNIYFLKYAQYAVVLFISIISTLAIESLTPNGFLGFLLKCIISVTVPNIIIWICYHQSEEYKYVVSVSKKFIGNSLIRKFIEKI